MRAKPALAFTILSVLCVSLAAPAVAQDAPTPEPPPAPVPAEPGTTAAPPETPKQEEGFFTRTFGNRFALYLEVGYGSGSSDPVETSVQTTYGTYATNNFTIEDLTGGRLTVGWTLPEDKGRFALTMNGFAEDGYSFDGVGRTNEVISVDNSPTAGAPTLQWWSTRIENGRLTSVRNPPYWQDSPPTDSQVQPDEIFYTEPDLVITKAEPESLQNRAQTWDLYYQRDFGGRRYSGRWTVGARYFVYDGNIPSAAWLIALSAQGGAGYTDGYALPLIITHQESSAFGPTGSAEFQASFYRKRLVLYARANVGFLLENLSADTGEFFTLVRKESGTELIPAPVHLQSELSQSVWHLGGEIGVRGRVAQGFDIYAAWSITGYNDAVLYPKQLLIPDLPKRIPLGTSALYKTRDIVYDQVMLGLAFQF